MKSKHYRIYFYMMFILSLCTDGIVFKLELNNKRENNDHRRFDLPTTREMQTFNDARTDRETDKYENVIEPRLFFVKFNVVKQ